MDLDLKACAFGMMVVTVYGIHQVSVGGDGIVLASVVGALAAIGGYVLRKPSNGS